MAEAMEKVAQEVRAGGGKPYIIPGGGSNAIGGLGYVACAQELQQQLLQMGRLDWKVGRSHLRPQCKTRLKAEDTVWG
jgi:1-aminocyclopropane-1-carboxylate deaminase/D-cysteine desulfhydrase-like pyridoxal-dependent ACC family enzyme